jgi:hypothetical protein
MLQTSAIVKSNIGKIFINEDLGVFANNILVFKWNIALPVIKKLVNFILVDTHYNQTTYKTAIWLCV